MLAPRLPFTQSLALALHPSVKVTQADVEQLAAGDTAPGAYDLADALVAGDLRATLSLAAARSGPSIA